MKFQEKRKTMLNHLSPRERKFWVWTFAAALLLVGGNFYDSTFAKLETVKGTILARGRATPLKTVLTDQSEWTVAVGVVTTRADVPVQIVEVPRDIYSELKVGQEVSLGIRRGALSNRVLGTSTFKVNICCDLTRPAPAAVRSMVPDAVADEIRRKEELLKAERADEFLKAERALELFLGAYPDENTNAKGQRRSGRRGK